MNPGSEAPWLLIGSGRLARHLQSYLSQLGLPFLHFQNWHRREQDQEGLLKACRLASRALMAVADPALPKLINTIQSETEKLPLVHFSGASVFSGAHAAHPLMTFADELYSLDFYKQIPFVFTPDESAPKLSFSEVLPDLPNLGFGLAASSKALYHARCVMGGNFISLLTAWTQKGLQDLQLPAHLADLYLHQSLQNSLHHALGALTGPLPRRDLATIQRHLDVLPTAAEKNLYTAFLEVYSPQLRQQLEAP